MLFLDTCIFELENKIEILKEQAEKSINQEEKKMLLMQIAVLEEKLKKYRVAFACMASMNTYENLINTPIVCEDSDDYGTFKKENGELYIVSGKTGNISPFEICFSPENFEYYLIAARLHLKTVDAIYPNGNLRGKYK